MTGRRLAAPRVAAALLALVVSADVDAALASEPARVGERPAQLLRQRNPRAPILGVLSPGTPLQVLDRDGDWCWVLAPPTSSGVNTQPGWVRKELIVPGDRAVKALETTPARLAAPPEVPPRLSTVAWQAPVEMPALPVPSGPSADAIDRPVVKLPAPVSPLVAAAQAARMASDANRSRVARSAGSARAATPEPPPPAGSVPDRASAFGTWIKPRAVRGSVGFGYQSARVEQASGQLDEQLFGALATVATSFAVLDPRILTVDFSGELQLNRTKGNSTGNTFADKTGLNSYRLELGVLTGRAAPLRIYTDRVSSSTDMQPMGDLLGPARRTHGVRTASGFTWDVSMPRVPRVQLSASTGLQQDNRDYLFGYSSTSRERRAELRVSGDRPRARFDVDFSHSDLLYDVPAASVRSRTGTDLLLATARFAPSGRLSVDLHARASRFELGTGSAGSTVTGIGGDVSVRYAVSENLAAAGRYTRSTNAFEAILSGQVEPGEPGAVPISTGALATPTDFSEGEARVEYSSRPFTATAIVRSVSFGVPSLLPPTLTALTTAGGIVRMERTLKGLVLTAGIDGSAGTARSNQGPAEPYRELGAQAGISGNVGRLLRFGLDGSVRRVGRLDFYPVNLDARFLTAHVETTRPSWAVLRASVTRFDTLRDIVYADNRDQHIGYAFGVSSRWFDVTADIGQSDTNPLLLSPAVLDSRPDIGLLLLTRPDLFRNLLVSTDRSRALSVQVRPLAGLMVHGRLRAQEQAYPGLFGYRVRGGQVWATYQLRDVQFEFGAEAYSSTTTFGEVRDARLYLRVRRDLMFIR